MTGLNLQSTICKFQQVTKNIRKKNQCAQTCNSFKPRHVHLQSTLFIILSLKFLHSLKIASCGSRVKERQLQSLVWSNNEHLHDYDEKMQKFKNFANSHSTDYSDCVVPENIHAPTTEGISRKSPPPPQNFHLVTSAFWSTR